MTYTRDKFSAQKFIVHTRQLSLHRTYLIKMFGYHRLLRSGQLQICAIAFSFIVNVATVRCVGTVSNGVSREDCQVSPVIHVLQYPGCIPKPIPSFACTGRCSSYVQVSGSKIWQMERSCMCCQESGEREATFSLFCPKARQGDKKLKKVTTKAPLECMCRPCTSVEESAVVPQEMVDFPNEQPINGHFAKAE